MRLVLIAAAVLIPAAAPLVAHADDLRVERIMVSDLNLASPQGEAAAVARVRAAARRVRAADSRPLRLAQAERACRRTAEEGAMARIRPMILAARQDNAPTVSASLR
jgi:UrcA family protein